MQSLSTSRASAPLSLVEQGVEAARPNAARESSKVRSKIRRATTWAMTLLRRLWHWIEQPEAPAPPSRPVVSNFYVNL